jgi:hypothetical protein
VMDWSAVAFRGKSSWISIIGSTVTEGVLHAEQVTVEVRAPAKVWSVLQLAARNAKPKSSRAIQLQLDI